MGAAVMMMSSMAIGASAYEAIKYGRAVGGSGSNAYISCFVTGIRTNSTVAGQAWTRTSSNNNNVYNPNCKYSGYVYASASVGGTGCGSSHSDTCLFYEFVLEFFHTHGSCRTYGNHLKFVIL